jgi:hypothetical protein
MNGMKCDELKRTKVVFNFAEILESRVRGEMRSYNSLLRIFMLGKFNWIFMIYEDRDGCWNFRECLKYIECWAGVLPGWFGHYFPKYPITFNLVQKFAI